MANYVKATNFTAKDSLPSGDSGKIVKGSEIDTELAAVANAIASKADINSPNLTGTPTAPTANLGSNTTQLATTAFVAAGLSALIPTGVITLWSGAIASIPSGWVLCNGSNSTPDLRDRFVVGAGSTYAVNATGGANTVTLDATMIPAHTHTFSATTSAVSNNHTHTFSGTTTQENTGHTHSISDPGHRHLATTSGVQGSVAVSGSNHIAYDTRVSSGLFTNENFEYILGGTTSAPNAGLTSSNTTGITGTNDISNNHNHNYSGTTSGMSADHTHTLSGTSGSTGGGLAHENRPPYFALAYIMKT
jgi:microcystin-dependent protein